MFGLMILTYLLLNTVWIIGVISKLMNNHQTRPAGKYSCHLSVMRSFREVQALRCTNVW